MSSIIITILIIIGLYNLNNQMEIANKHYYIKDRKIDLMEVLRLIQLFWNKEKISIKFTSSKQFITNN